MIKTLIFLCIFATISAEFVTQNDFDKVIKTVKKSMLKGDKKMMEFGDKIQNLEDLIHSINRQMETQEKILNRQGSEIKYLKEMLNS